jgi:hypothetical protein
MKFRVLWDPAALFVFYRLPLHSAKLADRAVIRFVERGEGVLEWDPPYHLLRAGFHDVVLAIDTEARTLTVLRIYRARR